MSENRWLRPALEDIASNAMDDNDECRYCHHAYEDDNHADWCPFQLAVAALGRGAEPLTQAHSEDFGSEIGSVEGPKHVPHAR